MQTLTQNGRHLVEAAASRHGFSTDAVYALLVAVAAGGGQQAQFNHWELGGMGQWSQGGMIMIGDMFNNGLKYRVESLCNDLSAGLQQGSPFVPPQRPAPGTSFSSSGSFGSRWPAELGMPSSSGSQNDLHYAVFPETRRLALDQGGHVSVYDIGDHHITGFSQAQGDGQSITFTSQYGLVRLNDLPRVPSGDMAPNQPFAVAPEPVATPEPSAPAVGNTTLSDDEIFSRIERLAELHRKDILTADEFSAKKAELLARL